MYADEKMFPAMESTEEMIRKIKKLEFRIKELEELVKVQKDYIKLLGDEINDLAPLASVHGWKSTRYEEGKRLRELMGGKDGRE